MIDTKDNPEREECVYCRRPYYWIYSSQIACNLRLVNKHWNTTFKLFIVIYPIRDPVPLTVCSQPIMCLEYYMNEVKLKTKYYRRVYLPII